MSGADVASMIAAINSGDRRNYDDSNNFGNNWIWIIGLLIVAGIFGGNGSFFGGRNNDSGALTRGELCQDMNFQSVENGVRGIQNGICDGFYATQTAISNLGYEQQKCCCETNRNIDAVRNQMSQDTCAIITNANENTQKILDKMCQYEIQGLRDKIVEQNSAIQSRDFQLSQLSQNATLINTLRPYPVQAVPFCGFNNGFGYNGGFGFNNGCGCNNCCSC